MFCSFADGWNISSCFLAWLTHTYPPCRVSLLQGTALTHGPVKSLLWSFRDAFGNSSPHGTDITVLILTVLIQQHRIVYLPPCLLRLPLSWLSHKESISNVKDARNMGSTPGSRRTPGEGNGNPLQDSWRIPWTEEPGGLHSMRLQNSWAWLSNSGLPRRIGVAHPSASSFVLQSKWSVSCIWLCVTPWTIALQAPPSMGFFRQEYWSG